MPQHFPNGSTVVVMTSSDSCPLPCGTVCTVDRHHPKYKEWVLVTVKGSLTNWWVLTDWLELAEDTASSNPPISCASCGSPRTVTLDDVVECEACGAIRILNIGAIIPNIGACIGA